MKYGDTIYVHDGSLMFCVSCVYVCLAWCFYAVSYCFISTTSNAFRSGFDIGWAISSGFYMIKGLQGYDKVFQDVGILKHAHGLVIDNTFACLCISFNLSRRDIKTFKTNVCLVV